MTGKRTGKTAPKVVPPTPEVTLLTAVIAETARMAVTMGAAPDAVVDAVTRAVSSGDVAPLEELVAQRGRPTIEVIRMSDAVPVPRYSTDGAIAWDIVYPGPEPVTIKAGRKVMLGTGLRIHVPDPNVGAFLHPRSSTGWKGLALANTTGVIDPDFQGELRLALRNTRRRRSIGIMPGDRVAQLVFVPVVRFEPVVVDEFSTTTERGHGAFGSTGR